MSRLNEILTCYGELAGTVALMVELARQRRWDALPGLDDRCRGIVGQLREMHHGVFSGMERSRILALAGRIRADQDELQSLVRPQFVHLVQRMADLQRAS